jgi:hypothetical protein
VEPKYTHLSSIGLGFAPLSYVRCEQSQLLLVYSIEHYSRGSRHCNLDIGWDVDEDGMCIAELDVQAVVGERNVGSGRGCRFPQTDFAWLSVLKIFEDFRYGLYRSSVPDPH